MIDTDILRLFIYIFLYYMIMNDCAKFTLKCRIICVYNLQLYISLCLV